MPTTTDQIQRPPMSATAAGRYWNVSSTTIRRLIHAGELPARLIGGQWRIDPDDLDALGR